MKTYIIHTLIHRGIYKEIRRSRRNFIIYIKGIARKFGVSVSRARMEVNLIMGTL